MVGKDHRSLKDEHRIWDKCPSGSQLQRWEFGQKFTAHHVSSDSRKTLGGMWPGAFIRLADYGEWLPTVCTDLGTIDFSSPEKGIFQSCAMTLKWHEISKQRRGVAIEATYKGRMTPSDGRVEDGFFERITRFKQLRYEDATLAENQETPAAAFGLSNTDGEYTRVVFVNINYRATDGVAPSLEEFEQSEGPLNTGPPEEGNGYEVRVTLPEYSLLIFV